MDVKLPKLGEGADSGVVVSLLVKVGDRVQEGQTILELENEKAVAPVPSPAAGTVARIRVKEGDKVSVGQVVLTLAAAGAAPAPESRPPEAAASEVAAALEEGTEAPAEPPARPAEPAAPAAGAMGWTATPAAKVAAAPAIRKLARELGIDLARVPGSARGGRIGTDDVRAYIQALQKFAFGPRPAAGPAEVARAPSIDFSKWGGILKKPVSPLRKTIAERMVENWTTIPHVTQFDEADITALNALRKKHAPAYAAKGVRLTLTGLVCRAVVGVLKAHPLFNSSLDEASGELILKQYYHLGLAVDTESGLIVPVLRDVDRKSVLELSREIEDLAARARERKVALEELRGGSFTISNQGGIGGGHFTPIVNKPEVAILGLGRGALKPVAREKRVEPRLLLPLALSYDHRVIDGGAAARFIVDLVQVLEHFPEADVALDG